MLNNRRRDSGLADDATKLIGIFIAIVVAIFAIATFYSLAATLSVDRAVTYLEDNGYTVFAEGETPTVTLVTVAVDADSSTTSSASGLEFISSNLTILRGCSDEEFLQWQESTDIWECNPAFLAAGSDADSTTTSSDSGFETIGTDLTLIRGCSNTEILKWVEATDTWDCSSDSGGSPTLVDPGSDNDTAGVTGNASGLELISGALAVLRSCDDNELIRWDESNDLWECETVPLVIGSDGDSTTISTNSGLEILSDTLSIIRGCSNNQVIAWIEATDTWDCSSASTDTGPSPDCSGTTTYQDGEGNCDTLDAGTDITADLEEESHCSEHDSADLDCSGETLIFAVDSLDFTEIVQSNTLAGDPALLVDECYFIATSGGGGFICEGSTADTAEQIYIFPDVNGSDTTNFIVVDSTQVTSIDGTGLTITGGVLAVDLGTSIETGEITDDEILEVDLDAVDAASDEECLTFETDNSGFEWQACGDVDQNLFSSITDGSNTATADSTSDTFTVGVSGNAVSATIDAGGDSLTIEVNPSELFDERAAMFIATGDVDTTMDIENIRIYNIFGIPGTIQNASCSVNTAPTSSAVTVDVNLSGTTIFTTQGNRPSITAGTFVGPSGSPDITTFSKSDYLQIEVDATDSGDTAADLSCAIQIRFRIYDSSS